MRLLFITRNFPPQTGGMEQYSWNLYQMLKRKTDTDLLANTRGKRFLPFFMLKTFFLVAFRGHRYSNIHLGDGVLAVVGLWARVFSRARISITIHALDVTYTNPIYQAIVRFCLKRLDDVICVSNYTKHECLARGVSEHRCHVIPNGLDLGDMPLTDNTLTEKLVDQYELKNKKILLSVGRLIRRKGMRWFVDEVFPRLPGDYVLLIAGDGPERNEIEKIIKTRRLETRVALLGGVDTSTKACLYSLASLFVMPNILIEGDSEGFGISIIEAAYYGTPCIATRLQGITDAVVDTAGVLVETGNAAEFQQAIQNAKFEHAEVSKAVRQRFDWSRLIDDYMKIFKPAN